MSPQVRGSVRRDPRESRRLPIREVEELWDVPKFAKDLPPNPRPTSHAPEHVCLRDIRGRQIVVAVCTIVKFPKMTSSVRIGEVTKLRKPVEARDLWTGARHHRLTHALRVLQVNSQKPNGTEPPREGMFRLREGIRAEELLASVGAQSVSVASDLLQMLRDHKLVVTRSEGNRYLCWVDKNVRGIGPNRELYTKQDLINDWVLPEFEYIAQDSNGAGHHDEEEGETEVPNEATPADLPPDEDGQTPPGQVGSRVQAERGGSSGSRLAKLKGCYELALEFVPEDAAVIDGWAKTTLEKTPLDLAAERLGIPRTAAANYYVDLRRIGLYRSEKEQKAQYVKVGVGVTEEHVKQARKAARDDRASRDLVKKAKPKGRLAHLVTAYEVVRGEIPEGVEPDAEGYVEFEASYSFKKLLADRIEDLSDNQAGELLKDLDILELLKSTPSARPGGWIQIRRVKVDYTITAKDIQRLRDIRSGRQESKNQDGKSKSAPEYPGDDVFQLLKEALETIDQQDDEIRSLNERLKERDRTIAQLQHKQAELEAQLAAQQLAAPPAQYASVAEELRSKLKDRRKN